MDIEWFKETLVADVDSSADWRACKAEEYPEDDRNTWSSESLFTLAETLKALPLDTPILVECARLADGVTDYTEINSFIGRYGFDGTEGDPIGFLKQYDLLYKVGDDEDDEER